MACRCLLTQQRVKAFDPVLEDKGGGKRREKKRQDIAVHVSSFVTRVVVCDTLTRWDK